MGQLLGAARQPLLTGGDVVEVRDASVLGLATEVSIVSDLGVETLEVRLAREERVRRKHVPQAPQQPADRVVVGIALLVEEAEEVVPFWGPTSVMILVLYEGLSGRV